MSPSSKHQFCIYFFGAFRIELNSQLIQLPTRKIESLLAYLILHPNMHAREKIATLFWGESSHSAARGSLRKALTLIRKYLNGKIIIADRENVQISSSYPLWVDVIEFQQQAQKFLANPSSHPNPLQSDLYQGELLSNFYDDWIFPLREKYHSLYIDVLTRMVEQLRAKSKYKLAIEYAQRILVADSTNERAHQHLMFCYTTLGDRNKALQQYDACQQALLDELDVEPASDTQALYRWIKQSTLATPSLAAQLTNLPIPISSFVGRNKELAKVKQLLSDARLVTLTGPGGSGKTRLAIHASTDLIDSFKDGVWWVELAPLTDSSLVPTAVTKALGINASSDQPLIETLKHYLRTKQALLVLDNCEHLIDACAHLTEALLTSCEKLKILTTSRETLSLTGENVWSVPALSLPDVQNITLVDLLMQYEGIRLFIERATAINPDFIPNDENAIAITKICQRLDGIPLAIELAAARIKTMPVGEISERLDDRFQLLIATNRTTQTRHQTLRMAVDWSYDLLMDDERELLCRLSIFSGGWTLDAAAEICSGDSIDKKEDIPDLLAQLTHKSLITVNVDCQRYGMLETMRQYGNEKLIQASEKDWVFQQFLDYYLHMADIGNEKIRGHEQLRWLNWFKSEQDNLSNAMLGALGSSGSIEKGCELVCSLGKYWGMVGDFVVMKYWLEMAYSRISDLENMETKAKLLFKVGFHSVTGLNWLSVSEAQLAIKKSWGLWCELGADFTLQIAQCLLMLGWIQKHFLKDKKGYKNMHEAISIFQEQDNVWWHAWALNLLGAELIEDSEDVQIIKNVLDEETSLWKKAGDQCMSTVVLWDLGTLASEHGDFFKAQEYFQENLQINRKFGAKGFIMQTLVHLGDTARGLKNFDQAEKYYKESEPLAEITLLDTWLPRIYRGLGYTALSNEEPQQAQEYFHRSLEKSLELNLKYGQVNCLAGYAAIGVVYTRLNFSARLYGAFFAQVDNLQSETKTKLKIISPVDQLEIEKYLTLCKSQISAVEFEEVWEEGNTLSLENVVNELLKEDGPV